jgi:putative ABC transport system permease protein
MDLNAVDARAFATVTDDTAAGVEWPREFLVTPPSADIGTQANAIPAILSPDFPPGRDELGIGDTFVIEVARQALSFQVVDRRAGFPGLGGAANSVTAPLDWISASLGDDAPLPTVMWLRASDDAGAPLATLVTASAGQIGLVSRQDAYSQIHDAPLGTAVADGFRVALGVAVLYLAITLVGAVVMSAAGRTRDLAYLRTLGVSTRQALALTAVEHAPPVLLALVPGVLLGVAVAHLVEPGLGLADFTGGRFVALSIDWPALGLVIAALSVVVVVSIGAGTWLAARARLVSALRIEDS